MTSLRTTACDPLIVPSDYLITYLYFKILHKTSDAVSSISLYSVIGQDCVVFSQQLLYHCITWYFPFLNIGLLVI